MGLGKKLTSMLVAVMLFSQPAHGLTLHIYENQTQRNLEVEPIIKGNNTYLPIRDIAKTLNYGVGWDQFSKEIVLMKQDDIIKINTKLLIENGNGFIEEGVTYIKEAYLEFILGVTFELEDLTATIGVKGEEIIELLMSGAYGEVVNRMDMVAKELIGEKIIRDHWHEIEKVYGTVQSSQINEVRKTEEYYQVDLRLITELAHVRATTTFNFNKELSGLHFSLYTYEKALPEGVKEESYTIETGNYTLPATLTLPEGEGPFPAVVLVHGSGANDQDETIGGVKVFRDLAYGLAERGIATLRYDKRTYTYQKEVAANPSLFNYEEEVIEDAVSAAELLKTIEGINEEEIYVLGHSLGGMSIPLISTKVSDISGYMMVAAPSRHLADLILEQIDYIATVEEMTSIQKQIYMDTVESQVEKVKSLTEASKEDEMLFAGINNRTWADLNGYDHVEMAKEMEAPLLVVQGGRDYQVTLADYAGWEEALGEMENVTLKAYNDLNHLLVEGEEMSVPKEYYMPNEVSEVLIHDMAQWITSTKGLVESPEETSISIDDMEGTDNKESVEGIKEGPSGKHTVEKAE